MPQCENSERQSISSTDLAWLAGIIDGEGSLEIEAREVHKALKPRIRIGNNSVEMIRKVSTIYAAMDLKFYYQLHNNGYHLSIWLNSFGSAERLLAAILPWVVAKKSQVMLLLDYIAVHKAMYAAGRYALRENLESWKTTEQRYKARLREMHNEKVDAQRLTRKASIPLGR